MFVIIVVVAFDTVVFSRFGPACRSAIPRFSLAERQGSSPVKSLLGGNALLHVFLKARDIGNEVTCHQAEGHRHFFLELTDVAELEPTQRRKHSTARPQQRHGSQVNVEKAHLVQQSSEHNT